MKLIDLSVTTVSDLPVEPEGQIAKIYYIDHGSDVSIDSTLKSPCLLPQCPSHPHNPNPRVGAAYGPHQEDSSVQALGPGLLLLLWLES